MGALKRLRIAALLLSLMTFPQLVMAVDVSPHIGTWAIVEENNGKPGRGFQFDVQNDVLVLYFYGYEQSGASTFWLAAGKFQKGSNELTLDLGTYEGGMAFGDPLKNAVYLGADGKVTLRFTGYFSGEICLPNESCKEIRAFNFAYPPSSEELLGAWIVTAANDTTLEAEVYQIDFLDVVASSNPNVVDKAIGTAAFLVNGIRTEADIVCERKANPDPYTYYCVAQLTGQKVQFQMLVARNGLLGQYYDDLGVKVEGTVMGFRVITANGRRVFPD